MIVIVAGMHRSGTSALAGLLHANGVVMGRDKDFYPPPMRENPKGFYENVRFRRINDRVLAHNDYKVKSWLPWPPDSPVATPSHQQDMSDLLESYYTEFDNWGWKDPRTSLVMNLWLSILDSYGLKKKVRIVQCQRDPHSVANSMRTRGNREKYNGQFEAVAVAYQQRLNMHVCFAGFKDNMISVRFVDLVRNTRATIDRVSSHIGVALDDLSHIDPALERTVDYAVDDGFWPESNQARG